MIQETGLQEREQDYRKRNRITGRETGLQEREKRTGWRNETGHFYLP